MDVNIPAAKSYLVDAVDKDDKTVLSAAPVSVEWNEDQHGWVASSERLGSGRRAQIAEAAVQNLLAANGLSLRALRPAS